MRASKEIQRMFGRFLGGRFGLSIYIISYHLDSFVNHISKGHQRCIGIEFSTAMRPRMSIFQKQSPACGGLNLPDDAYLNDLQ